jgi:hypothetical protein
MMSCLQCWARVPYLTIESCGVCGTQLLCEKCRTGEHGCEDKQIANALDPPFTVSDFMDGLSNSSGKRTGLAEIMYGKVNHGQ